MKKIALAALALVMLLPMGLAQAQIKLKSPQEIRQDIKNKLDQTNAGVKAAVTGQSDPNAALPCMDISVITKLTPTNLVPTIEGCHQDGVKQLVSDTSRALKSAQDYVGTNGGATGDNDGIACLKPALSLFQAGLIIPAVPAVLAQDAVPAVPAVLNPDGSIKTQAVPAIPAIAAVAAVPEVHPGPILLYQKFREFTLAGGQTACPTWFNGPIQAVLAAGAGAVGTATAAVALIPK